MTDHAETMSRGSAVHDEQTGAATRDAAGQGGDGAGAVPDTIETGKRLIHLSEDRGSSLADRIAARFYRLTWRTPLHTLRLRGRYPLQLLGVPEDPIPGNPMAGKALRAGHFLFRGLKLPTARLDFAALTVPPAFADYIHSFAWLRDLAAAGTREDVAPIAEALQRRWLDAHDATISEPAWRPDNAGWRLLYWMAYAPALMATGDHVHRSRVLNGLARTARHLDRTADTARAGVPQLVAWAGVVAAGLGLPGGEARRAFGEARLRRALLGCFYADGGTVSRSPAAQADAIAILSMLSGVYRVRKLDRPTWIDETLAAAVPALTALTHGDGGLGNWQGSGATDADTVRAVVAASGIRARPLRQARDWGYQRLIAGRSLLLVDSAPPPVARATDAGCASTLAIEFSDGPHRIIVNCGGAALADLARGLRTTAAHSTLTLGDLNSTAIHADGTLGKGVTLVEIDRREVDGASRVELSHDGYAKRHGFIHRRLLMLANSGRELRGEDMLVPHGRKRRGNALPFTIRFHLGPDVEPSMTADGQAALLRLSGGALWQLRCAGATMRIDESLWVDGDGRPNPTYQLELDGTVSAGGGSVGWLLKHIG
ncbi:MAG: heparinase II/III family protein [Sphingopyxis sp.]|nr:heparinase II/III family protein [Sphingopyxis sp.]